MELPTNYYATANRDPWVERIVAVVENANLPVVFHSRFDDGLRRVAERLSGDRQPLVWVDLTRPDGLDGSLVASRYAEALNRVVGSGVVPSTSHSGRTLDAFARIVPLLGPFTIVVSCSHFLSDHLQELLRLHQSGNRVVIVSREPVEPLTCAGAEVVPDDVLRMRHEEAVCYTSTGLDNEAVLQLLSQHEFDYVRFVDAVRRLEGLPPLWLAPGAACLAEAARDHGVDAARLAEALVRRNRFVEALELMCVSAPQLVPSFIDACAEAFFGLGLYERLWQCLKQLDGQALGDERVVRWLYSAAMAVNRHPEVSGFVEGFLRNNEAPDLRALFAASRPSKDFLAETTRAVAALASPTTLRHHAFALSLDGQHEKAFECLNRALRLADLLGNDQLVVAVAADTCIALQRVGKLQDSLWWGQWSVDEYARRGIQEDLRRVTAAAALVFSKLLTGEVVGIAELVEKMGVTSTLAGVPSYEGVISVVADFCAVSGDLHRARELYEVVYASSPLDVQGLVAVDLVSCLIASGDAEEALGVGTRVMALSMLSSQYQADCAALAYGMALKAIGDPRAYRLLEDAITGFRSGSDMIRLTQASLQLAEMLLTEGYEEAARRVIAGVEECAAQLGDTGWRLLVGESGPAKRVREFVSRSPTQLHMCTLGVEDVTRFGRSVVVSGRPLEALVLLAHSESGMSVAKLSVALYGDNAVQNTTKALVSRLRQTIPLSSRPYRIAVPYRADFLELLEHLRRGHVRQALNLYRDSLLPTSEAPAIVELREHIDEALRQAVLSSGDWEAMLELSKRTGGDDLEVLEAAERHVPANDPQAPLLRARIRQIRRDWES